MPYGNTWLVEGHLILVKAWGAWDAAQLDAFDMHGLAILNSITLPLVHNIFDVSKLTAVPSLTALRDVRSRLHPKAGWSLYVGLQNPVMRFALSATSQISKNRARFLNTIPEALEFIQLVDSTLPDLSQLDIASASERAMYEKIAVHPVH